MYGPEYLDWCDYEAAAATLDAFLAGLASHERKWVLAVVRKRFEVRVEYRDNPLGALAQQNLLQQSSLARQRGRPSDSLIGSLGGGVLRGLW